MIAPVSRVAVRAARGSRGIATYTDIVPSPPTVRISFGVSRPPRPALASASARGFLRRAGVGREGGYKDADIIAGPPPDSRRCRLASNGDLTFNPFPLTKLLKISKFCL